ncbi:MAG TPA: sigma factor-like helix-turn-helix DNA-binding protein, partial [Longimicrobiales bacterium]|nr:sigma factor-like helix-turn-helix DNA-binding protein [Longimicrobiales bacterium]
VLQHADLVRDGTEIEVDRAILGAALDHAISNLPEPFRSAVVLVDVEDQSYQHAAEVLDVPIGTVRSRLFRGRRQLQESLLNFAHDAGLRAQPTRAQ